MWQRFDSSIPDISRRGRMGLRLPVEQLSQGKRGSIPFDGTNSQSSNSRTVDFESTNCGANPCCGANKQVSFLVLFMRFLQKTRKKVSFSLYFNTFRCSLKAKRLTVNQLMGVRFPPTEQELVSILHNIYIKCYTKIVLTEKGSIVK